MRVIATLHEVHKFIDSGEWLFQMNWQLFQITNQMLMNLTLFQAPPYYLIVWRSLIGLGWPANTSLWRLLSFTFDALIRGAGRAIHWLPHIIASFWRRRCPYLRLDIKALQWRLSLNQMAVRVAVDALTAQLVNGAVFISVNRLLELYRISFDVYDIRI